MPTQPKAPTLQKRDMGSIVTNCIALAVSVCFAGGAWIVMR